MTGDNQHPAAYEHGKPIFKEYVYVRFIGRGGFGKVYLVENEKGYACALKVLHRGFRMENRGVASVQKISSIYLVNIRDHGNTVAGEPCILMEYIPNNLKQMIDDGKVSEDRACRYFTHLLRGLDVLEKNAILHRDIKPENLFIIDDIVKIGDFGTAKYASGETSETTSLVGSFRYMAPERYTEKYDHSVDRWAAAALFYRMLTGEHAFGGRDSAQVYHAIHQTGANIDRLPEKYRPFFKHCFEKDISLRHQSAREMLDAFRNIGAEPVKIPKKTKKAKPKTPESGGGAWKKPVIAFMVVLALIFAAVLTPAWDKIKSVFGETSIPHRVETHALKIQTSPEGADIRFDAPGMEYQEGMKLKPGIYAVSAEKVGYHPAKTKIVIKDEDVLYKISLDPITYRLRFSTNPETATIEIVNPKVDYKPDMDVKPGKYDIRISADGYETDTRTVTMDENRNIAVTLREIRYALTVNPTPADALVQIMNITPPYEPGILLKPDKYHIRVSKQGYDTKDAWVDIVDGEKTISMQLEPLTYRLNISTVPENARVEMIDPKMAFRPNMDLPPKDYKIRVSSDGYDTETKTITLNKDIDVRVALTEIRYGLTIRPTPTDAQVRILNITPPYQDGILLKPGKYNVEVSKAGYETWSDWVDIADMARTIKVPLKAPTPVSKIRSEPKRVPRDDALKEFNLEVRDGLWKPKKYVQNDFVDKGLTVFDRATGLLWQKSGSPDYITYEDAGKYVAKLNREKFAGHDDWRLPTVDELITLLEEKKSSNDLYFCFGKITIDKSFRA